jgi:anti-sigma-K factor RskA
MEAEVHTLTGAYVCDALADAERAAFEAHMDRCTECAAEVRELREVAVIMAAAVAARPPASLKAALDARTRVTRQHPPIIETQPPTDAGRSRPRFRAAWAITAALALLVAGLGWHSHDQQHQINAQGTASTQISQVLAAPDAVSTRVEVDGGGTATVIDSRTLNEAVVTFTDLPTAPQHSNYQLWLMTLTGAARSVGLMATTPDTPILVKGLTGESQVGMTIEPVGGSPQPTSAPVMTAALG